MNVTSKGRYSLRVMLDLAQHPSEGFVSLKTVAERQGISMKYLEMIVGCLKKAELLDSTRGKEVGYQLNRAPSDFSVGEILRSIEDNLAPSPASKTASSSATRRPPASRSPCGRNWMISPTPIWTGSRWRISSPAISGVRLTTRNYMV